MALVEKQEEIVDTMTDSTLQHSPTKPKTGIKVIVVGAGFGGLTTAIECHRAGHTVLLYESFPIPKPVGDIVSFGPNGGRIFYRWGDSPGEIASKMRAISIDLQEYGFNIHKWTGELVCNQKSAPRREESPVFNGHKGELHQIVFEYAKSLGVEVNLRRRVVRYLETEGEAGIELEGRERVMGDVVVGADGVRSKARELVLGYDEKPKSSGYVVFRAWFPNAEMIKDPETRRFCENGDTFNGWIGPDMHFPFSTIKNGSDCCWVLTHKDGADIDESWSFPGKLEDVYKVFEGWDPLCKRIVSKTPECHLVHWKLVYRDPLPTWGATQSIEDGVMMAVCLRKGGKESVPDAVRAYMDIKYERVRAVQKTGETTRDMWHKADWDEVAKDPSKVQFPREDWIFERDAEKYAEDNFDESFQKVREGRGAGAQTNEVGLDGMSAVNSHL